MAKVRGTYSPEVLESAQVLSGLTGNVLNSVIEAVATLPPNLSISRALSNAAIQIDGFSHDEIQQLLSFIFSVKNFSDRSHRKVSEIVEEIARAANLQGETSDKFCERLNALLNDPNIARWQKALSLISEHERVILDARLITDARPVYVDDPENMPSAFVLFHMLKITYREDSDIRDIFLALDSDDLIELKKIVDKAFKKRTSLTGILERTNTPIFDLI
jgi:hypothetical protein